MLNELLIAKIGLHTLSGQVSLIMFSTFVTGFINTGIVLMLTNANLSHYPVLSWIPLKNQFPDMDRDWYDDIGPALFKTTMIIAFMPYFEFAIAWGIKTLLRMLDSGCYCCRRASDPMRTRKTTP